MGVPTRGRPLVNAGAELTVGPRSLVVCGSQEEIAAGARTSVVPVGAGELSLRVGARVVPCPGVVARHDL